MKDREKTQVFLCFGGNIYVKMGVDPSDASETAGCVAENEEIQGLPASDGFV